MIIYNLRKIRELHNLRQKDIANIFNVKPSTVSGWETGIDPIPLKRLVDYANYFKVTLDYLFGITQTSENFQNIIINKNIISKNLKNLRIKNNLTQEYVAKILNTNQSSFTHYETGINLIPTSFLFALTKIYMKFSIDELFFDNKQ